MTLPADTTHSFDAIIAERHRAMSPQERLQVAASLSETARQIVRSSLPAGLSREEQRLALAKRLYGAELPEAALLAYARFPER